MKKILFMLPLLAVALVSCNKDNGGNGDGSEKLVREITYRSTRDNTERVMTYEYDSQNRITRMIETYGVGDYPTEGIYEYGEGSILALFGHKENGNWIEHICYKYYLDNDGYVVKLEGIEDNEVLNGTMNLEYENGQLKVISEDGRDGLLYCYWDNGDMVGLGSEEWRYTSIENKTNLDMMALTEELLISQSCIAFKGITSKHLPDEYYGGSFSYEFDSEGCPTKIVIKSDSDAQEYIIQYY